MTLLKCLIIEDEIPAAELLKMYIEQMSEQLSVTHVCHTANDAYRVLKNGDIDLIFLDMELSGRMNGIDFLQFTEENQQRPPVIVTTGKKEYLPESFEFNVKAYLFKPFSFETFRKKVKDVLSVLQIEPSTVGKSDELPDYIFIKITEKGHSVTKKLDISKLKYIEAKDKQSHYHLEDGSKWSVWDSLETISRDILPKGSTCRAHDKWLIASKKHIIEVRWTDDYLLVADNTKIPIGQTYKSGLKKYFGLVS